MDEDLKVTVARIDTNVEMLLKQLPPLEERMRTLEQKTSWLTGAGLVIAAIAAKAGFGDIAPLFWGHN